MEEIRILVTFRDGDLWQGVIPNEYARVMEDRLRQRWPGADVRVLHREGNRYEEPEAESVSDAAITVAPSPSPCSTPLGVQTLVYTPGGDVDDDLTREAYYVILQLDRDICTGRCICG